MKHCQTFRYPAFSRVGCVTGLHLRRALTGMVSKIQHFHHLQKPTNLKNFKFAKNGSMIYQAIQNFMKNNNFLLSFLLRNSTSFYVNCKNFMYIATIFHLIT